MLSVYIRRLSLVSWLAKEEAPDCIQGGTCFLTMSGVALFLSTGTTLKRTRGGQIEEEAFRTEVTEI